MQPQGKFVTAKRTAAILALITLLGFAAWTSVKRLLPTTAQQPAGKPGVEQFMTGVQVRAFDHSGKLSSVLTGRQMSSDGKDTHITADRFSMLSVAQQGPNWHISADRAQTLHDGKQVILSQNVKVVQPPGQDSQNITLLTSSLNYDPKTKMATTDAPVTIIRPDMTVHGTGMIANLKTGVIKLLHDVRGDYLSKKTEDGKAKQNKSQRD